MSYGVTMSWDIAGKTVVVTGATRGIGLGASVELAAMGARVVVIGRDVERTRDALDQVRAASRVEPFSLLCDFESQASIRALATELLARCERIDVLVNNAGTVNATRRLTVDGIEATFAVNHLGYFLLTNLLLDRLRASAPARIVTVASRGHRFGTMDLGDPGYERGYQIMRAYNRSKLANVLFSNELARRLEGSGVTSNSLHPGGVATNIWSGAPGWAQPLLSVLVKPFLVPVEQGARTIVLAAVDPALSGVTGRYFSRGRPGAMSRRARDEELAARLWALSAELVGLSDAERACSTSST